MPELQKHSKHDADIPEIIDNGPTLDAFYAKLARVVRGEPGVLLRIGIYGDSNLANDRTLGYLRRTLQNRWGDGGHGWVAFGLPWVWYKHMDIEHGTTGAWSTYNISNNHAPDYWYGFAGTAAESSDSGATAWVATAASKKAPTGKAVTSFDVFYLARPNGGTFDIAIDDKHRETIDSKADAAVLKVAHYDVESGPHKLVATVKRGKVRLFGAVLEHADPKATGIVIDSLGIASLNPYALDTLDHTMTGDGLAARNYDLLLETSGSNMCSSKYLPSLIEVWRKALPKAGLLLWSPPDAARFGKWDSDPLMKTCEAEKRAMAKDHGLAYWDHYGMLGGFGSMPKWLRDSQADSWAEPDGLHLGPALNKYIAERWDHAVLVGLARRAHDNPQLGCGSSPAVRLGK